VKVKLKSRDAEIRGMVVKLRVQNSACRKGYEPMDSYELFGHDRLQHY
jgi:hypothetical protein